MKTNEVREKALSAGFDTFSRNKAGNFVVRASFYYTHGITADMKVQALLKVLPTANIVDSGEIWKPFIGGASLARQSHWYVEFNFERK